ncbi:MAG: RnfABCDGE type electron transport complex subunit D [Alphaproteobacteria bacterium]|nr:RnfABCDGE type electron transport complex subunit D [Alphaproteobacteria bacterium]
MSTPPPLVGGPYLKQSPSVTAIMGLVMVALAPATLYGFYQFGWPAINLFVVTVASAWLCEAGVLKLTRQPLLPAVGDGSALLTGWLLAMTLPPWAPWWVGVMGSFFAIVLAKQVFGGLGQNLFNPAMVARVILLISFPVQMTYFVAPLPLGDLGAPGFLDGLAITFGFGVSGVDAVSSASILGHIKTELGQGVSWSMAFREAFEMRGMIFGTVPGSLGETSAPLLILGGMLLLGMRIITWHIPLAMMGTIAIMAGLFNVIDPLHYPDAWVHLLSGATVLGAFFIATDLVTSPSSPLGKIVFGVGCGALAYIIRTWGGYPEGIAFAVLIMNAATPLIDRYIKPRVYGRTTNGKPLEYGGGEK